MILHIKDVLARARERGYDPAGIKPCLTVDLGDGWYDVDVHHPAYPHRRDAVTPAIGLGDYIKAGLSALGITEARVSKAIGRPCGCSERAKKLNAIGRRIGIG